MSLDKIKNPLTGRFIKINGPTYIKLIKDGILENKYTKQPFYNLEKLNYIESLNKHKPIKGWSNDSPKLLSQRRKMLQKCGDTCFLKPDTLSFPICPNNICKIDCRGVTSAYIRASQWKYNNIKKTAKAIKKKKCYQN